MANLLLGSIAAFAVADRASPAPPQLVSRNSGRHGAPSKVASRASIDGSGRYLAFESAGLNGGRAGLYLRDIERQRTVRIADGHQPVLDLAGDRVIFSDGNRQLIARDLRPGSLTPAGEPQTVPATSGEFSASGNGRFVAFASSSWTLLEEPDRAREREVLSRGQIYVRDLERGRTVLVSRAGGPRGGIGDQESSRPSISAGGRYVAFTSEAGNLVRGGAPGRQAVYMRDLRTSTLRVVAPRGGNPARVGAINPSISADGHIVAYVLSRVGHEQEVAVRDLRRGTTLYPGRFSAHRIPIAINAEPELSPDGRFLAVIGGVQVGGIEKLFLVDLRTHRIKTVPEVGAESTLDFSSGGRFLTFDTFVENIPGRESGEMASTHGEVYRLANPFLR